jgi:hypothetical protein
MWVSKEPRMPLTSNGRPFDAWENRMKLTPWYLAAIAPIAVAGCSGAFLGHLAVLAVVVGIFVGTLSLGRTGSGSSPAAPSSHERA